MLHPDISSPSPTLEDREARIQTLMERLRPQADQTLRRLAEILVDAPDHELLHQVEYDLRDAVHDLAAAANETGLESRKKGGTWGRA